mmetsp:Transcript_40476/g.65768  ORF Transcript_40476/g.65768 Transcript_40476/m.65768 type:complete len:282 (+) Transcript_40476:160-1005(+)|eukprot:jgi/Bigna1/78423/fgenesh1_pg.54_\
MAIPRITAATKMRRAFLRRRPKWCLERQFSSSVYQDEEFRSFKVNTLRQSILPTDSNVVVDFTSDPEMASLFDSFDIKKTNILSPKSHNDAENSKSTETVVTTDFFSFSQRAHDPWIDRALLIDPALDVELKSMADFFYGLFQQMKADGRLVIYTRPHDCSHYPFFPLLADYWKRSHPPVTFFTERLQKVGFDVKMKSSSIIVHTSFDDWTEAIRSMRPFEDIDEDDFRRGFSELEMMIDGSENIAFEEKVVTITGIKPRDGRPTETLIVQEEGPPYGHCG